MKFIRIEEYEDPRYQDTLTSIHLLADVPGRSGNTRTVVERHLGKHPQRAYEIAIAQKWLGIGAGAYWEETLIRLFDATTSGAAEAVMLTWPVFSSTRYLKTRIQRHLISCGSNISTSTSAISLNPEYFTKVRWWRRLDSRNPQKRRAAEWIAGEVLQSVLRTWDLFPNLARVHVVDQGFYERTEKVFNSESTWCLTLPMLGGAL